MCSMGKGAPSTQTNQQQSSAGTGYAAPNPTALAAYNDLLTRAQGVASTPYQPYTGEITAPINPQQTAGINNINQYAGFAQPFIQSGAADISGAIPAAYNAGAGAVSGAGFGATGAINNASNAVAGAGYGANYALNSAGAGGTNALNYAQGAVNAAQPIGSQQINSYLNPYTNQIVGATEAQFANMNAQQQQNVLSGAAAQGALGGDRVGVAQGILGGQQALAEAPVIAGLYSQGYNQATDTALREQAAQVGAGFQGANTALGAGQLGVSGGLGAGSLYGNTSLGAANANLGAGSLYANTSLGAGSLESNTGLGAGYGMANLGTAGQSAGLQGAGAQIGAGTLQQNTQQAADAANYQQYLVAQGYPYQQAQWLANIITGVGSQMGGTSGQQTNVSGSQSVTPPPPSFLGQAIGAGVAGASMLPAKRGGRISGFADGGSPFDSNPYSYIPTANLKPGSTMPAPPSTPGMNFPSRGQPQQPSFADNLKSGIAGAQGLEKLYNKFGPDASNITIPGLSTDTAGMAGVDFGSGTGLGADATGSLAAWSDLPVAGFGDVAATDAGLSAAAAAPAAWSALPVVADAGAEAAAGAGAAAGGFDLMATIAAALPFLALSKGGSVRRRSGGHVPTVAGFGTGGIILPRSYADGGDTFDDRWNAFGSQSGTEPSAVWDQAPPTPSGVEPSAVWGNSYQPSDAEPSSVWNQRSLNDRFAGLDSPSMASAVGPAGMPDTGVTLPGVAPLPTARPAQSDIDAAGVAGVPYGVTQGTLGGTQYSAASPDQTSRSQGDAYQIAERFLKPRIASVESGAEKDPYSATTVAPKNGRTMLGKYQVDERNVPEWTREALGRPLTPQEFLASPEAQERVATVKLGQYVSKYGIEGATRAWFAGERNMNNLHGSDGYNTVAQYQSKVLGGAGSPQLASLEQGVGGPLAFSPEQNNSGVGPLRDIQNRAPLQAAQNQQQTAPQDNSILGRLGIHLSPAMREGLLSAGLGMMASRSPYLGQSIGEGGLQGLAAYHQEQAREASLPKIEAQTKLLMQQVKEAQQKTEGTQPLSPYENATLAMNKMKLAETMRQHDLALKTPIKYGETRSGQPLFALPRPGPNGIEFYPIDPRTNELSATPLGGNALKNTPANTGPTGGFTNAVDRTQLALDSGPPVQLRATAEPASPQARNDAYLAEIAKDDPRYAADIKAISNYQMSPAQFSLRNNRRERAMGDVMLYDPTYDQRRYNQTNRAITSWAQSQEGRQTRSFSVLIDHLGTAQELGEALQNDDVQAINLVKNKLKEQFGYGGPPSFDAAKQIVADEIAKAVIGGTNAERDREGLQNSLKLSNSPEQLVGVISTFKKLMAGQVGGLKQTYETATGLHNFDDWLTPPARLELSKINAGRDAQLSGQTIPHEGDRRQFKQGWGVFRNGKWVPEASP